VARRRKYLPTPGLKVTETVFETNITIFRHFLFDVEYVLVILIDALEKGSNFSNVQEAITFLQVDL